jgi:subfamily B ATP-binding cassette protein HlyB/CyaB
MGVIGQIEAIGSGQPQDGGLTVLVQLLRAHGIGADAGQIRHQAGGTAIGVDEMLRIAKRFELKARCVSSNWKRLLSSPVPAIAALSDGDFLLVGKAVDDKVMVQSPTEPKPKMLTRAEFEAVWDRRLIFFARRASLQDLARRFDVTWFVGAIYKYRWLLGEVLLASFVLQLFALVSPLFFQVVIDKVLVHRGLTTLDVLVLGLVIVSVFETVLGTLRT